MTDERFLNDKTAWISGASRGIGRAIAEALAEAGATVCLGARTADDIEQLAASLTARGLKAHPIILDVASRDSVAAFATRAVELAGPPEILVNNAGGGVFQDMDIMSEDEFDRQIDLNLKGPWYLMKHAVPHMKRMSGGTILNISSIAGSHSFRRGTAYCAAKAGLNTMSQCLMLELREFGIRVVTISPGSVDTGFHKTALPGGHHNDQTWMLEPPTVALACLHALRLPDDALLSHYEIRPLRPSK